jgi:hypothetical protein
VQVIIAEELCVLFVAQAIVDEDKSVAIFDEETTHGPCAEVVFVGGICFLPDRFRYHTKHRAPIQFKKSGVDYVKLQGLCCLFVTIVVVNRQS